MKAEGFAPKQRQFCLRIQAETQTFPVHFFVQEQKEDAAIKRASHTAIAIFAIAQYGTNADGYSEIAELFGDDYAEQMLTVHKQICGQDFIGKLRNSDGFLVMSCASRDDLIDGLFAFNSEVAIARLK